MPGGEDKGGRMPSAPALDVGKEVTQDTRAQYDEYVKMAEMYHSYGE